MVWHGVARCGVVWRGVVCDVVWRRVAWWHNGVVACGCALGVVRIGGGAH